ncbi:MAG: signal peptidase I [Patescibacteria group bacterium]
MNQELKQSVFEIVRFILLTLIIVIPIRAYVAQPFIVSGVSMIPTFDNNEYLIIDELSYHFRDPQRGEVIVFRFPNDQNKFFIKRIIGLPKETINIQNGKISVTSPSGDTWEMNEPYIEETEINSQKQSFTLSEDEYLVLGDNRQHSSDSRVWGPVVKNLIEGRALVRLFPLSHISWRPGDFSQHYLNN